MQRNAHFICRGLAVLGGLLAACGPLEPGEVGNGAGDTDERQLAAAVSDGARLRIEAEDFDQGGEGVAYHDTTPGNKGGAYRAGDVDIQVCGDRGGGFNVGWIEAGEYLVYTFTAPVTGRYDFSARLSSGRAMTKRLTLEVDGAALPATSFTFAEGWQVYRKLALGSARLAAGKHTLRLVARTAGFNANAILIDYAAEAPACTVTDKLVNTCRPWLGAWAAQSPDAASDPASQLLKHEQRIGRPVDIVHSYHPVGSRPLSSYERKFLERPDTILLINWKPAARWADADGRSSSVNAGIDATANALKSVAPQRVMLAVYHEPEDNVSAGVSCVQLKGNAGSPTDYRNMWRNVRKRFDALGVTNVVWVWNVMGYSGWSCMIKDLYPGNDLVDWVMWDPYIRGANDSFDQSIGSFYKWMEANSDAAHAFTTKAWGLAEWGTWGTDQPTAYKVYDDARLAVERNSYPRLKALVAFDARSNRIAYAESGAYDPVEVQHYRAFAQSAAFRD